VFYKESVPDFMELTTEGLCRAPRRTQRLHRSAAPPVRRNNVLRPEPGVAVDRYSDRKYNNP